jgi:hypothetical protein
VLDVEHEQMILQLQAEMLVLRHDSRSAANQNMIAA